MKKPKLVRGFLETLTPEQLKRALDWKGDDTIGSREISSRELPGRKLPSRKLKRPK